MTEPGEATPITVHRRADTLNVLSVVQQHLLLGLAVNVFVAPGGGKAMACRVRPVESGYHLVSSVPHLGGFFRRGANIVDVVEQSIDVAFKSLEPSTRR